jgi:hypothetical protein
LIPWTFGLRKNPLKNTLDSETPGCKGNAKRCERYIVTLALRNAYIEGEKSGIAKSCELIGREDFGGFCAACANVLAYFVRFVLNARSLYRLDDGGAKRLDCLAGRPNAVLR